VELAYDFLRGEDDGRTIDDPNIPRVRGIGALFLILGDMWTVFSSYFGGKPANPLRDDRLASRVLVVSVLLTGNVVFMAYRASVTSELAAWSLKMPFSDLQGLLSRPDIR